MKTIIILIVSAATFSSCTKEYTCQCSNSFFSSKIEEITIQARSKSNAKNICIDRADALVGQQCQLKQ